MFKKQNRENYLIGRNALKEILLASPKRVKEVYVVDKTGGDADYATIISEVKTKNIPLHFLSKEELSALVGTFSHQSFAALIEPKPSLSLKEVLDQAASLERSVILLLDGIEDPQNLGSILRASECFGVCAVVWGVNRAVGMTPAVRKASVGASELVNYVEVVNLSRALEQCKEANFWIIGAGVGENMTSIQEFEFPKRAVIVLGSEGNGISRLVREKCDFLVKIPLKGKIDSLNVGQACAVILYAYHLKIQGNPG